MNRISRRFKFFTFTVALLMGSTAGSLMAADRAIDKDVYFYPSTKWKTEKNGANCSIQNKFNNGFVVGLSGSDQWVRSLSVNFRQKIFDTSKTYDVKLAVPGVHENNFKAAAKTQDTIVVNLKGDKEFYKKLRQGSVLDLAIGGNDFRFYMTGFNGDAKAFENCMAGKMGVASKVPMNNEAIAMERNTKALLPSPSSLGSEALLDAEAGDIMPEDGITPKTRQRLTEQLAKTIKRDPSLIDMDQNQKNPRLARRELEMPPRINMTPSRKSDDDAVEEDRDTEDLFAGGDDLEEMELGKDVPPTGLAPIPSAKPEAAAEESVADADADAKFDDVLRETSKMSADEADAKDDITPAKVNKVEKETIIFDDPPALKKSEDEPLEDGMKAIKVSRKDTTRHSVPAYTMNKSVQKRNADFTGGVQSDQLRKDVLKMESMIEQLKDENQALNQELSTSLKDSKVENYTIESQNWNLEQATQKFNEAERQLTRMGQKLEGERARCNAEKGDLEAMLFDPNVTDEAQLARLSDLEKQLQDARDEVEAQREKYENQIRILQTQNGR